MDKESYKCECCGGTMEFDVKTQKLKCPNCDNMIEIIDNKNFVIEHKFTLIDRETIKVSMKNSSTMECQGCGAHVEVASDCTAVSCPYCGSSYVLAEKQEEILIPDGVIPFKVEKAEIAQMMRKWIYSRWLAPNKLKALYENDKIQGIYVPYWTFDAMVDCPYTAMGGRDRQVAYQDREGKVHYRTETDWFFTKGRINYFFDDVQVTASRNMNPSLINGIEPFTTKDIASYSPSYLSGFSAETYSIGLEEGNIEAKKKMRNELHRMAEKEVTRHYDRVREVRLNPSFYDETYKHVLLPVYATSYSYNGKNYHVLINGETGKMKGDYPKSPFKIAILVIFAMIIAAIILYLKNHSEIRKVSFNNNIYQTQLSNSQNIFNNIYEEVNKFNNQEVYIHGVIFKSVL
ncbi:hypothetical protein [Clostridium cellulovorans]|uniref:Replication restart DNA helicase PriA n=1 Tax=Clostridium cellulovorans (strain ATCC 35296 / DSM 3052 / OCM 3 / 743B) TaxID=573061 RepID=D9SR56_CLOC7|nr:hypothetical protein [Clostridium cellulovorans]ADL50344.1 hypothetical protein Clocel_0573 [Clostridium cellulovorans 743B]